jgi:hypothetical protein
VTLQRARDRAKTKDNRTRRQRLREALLGDSGWVKVERLTPAARAARPVWRTERYGPGRLGTHRDPRFVTRDLGRSR